MEHPGNRRSLIAIAFSIALLLILFLCMAISAQIQPPEVIVLSEPIRLSADPVSITADGVSTSTITADVVWPEGFCDELTGKPACLVNVSFYTTLGNITAYNITRPTPDNQSCIATATLTAGTETGVATITAWADIAPNETAIVRNTTTVAFLAAGGNGGGGDGGGVIPPTPTRCSQVFYLKEGWNLISFEVMPDNKDPFAIFGYEIWWYDPNAGWQTPSEIEGWKGYFIHCSEDREVVIPTGTKIKLNPGYIEERIVAGKYNLVGPGGSDYTLRSGFYDVWEYDKVTRNYRYVPDKVLRKGKGYWVIR